MSLRNLVGVSLETITPSKQTIRHLLDGAARHIAAIQTLQLTLDLERPVIIRLDALRKQRNVAEYSGDVIPESTVTECLSQAEALYARADAWLKSNRPDLL